VLMLGVWCGAHAMQLPCAPAPQRSSFDASAAPPPPRRRLNDDGSDDFVAAGNGGVYGDVAG
jgi:hypothetical protein